jgi:hypothetical protein
MKHIKWLIALLIVLTLSLVAAGALGDGVEYTGSDLLQANKPQTQGDEKVFYQLTVNGTVGDWTEWSDTDSPSAVDVGTYTLIAVIAEEAPTAVPEDPDLSVELEITAKPLT